ARRISGSLKHTNVIDGLFFYPSKTRKSHSLLVLLSSLSYVNPLKERFFARQHPKFWAKAGAKVRLFSKPTKLFHNFFSTKQKVFAFHDKSENLTPYYII
ncbi:MAG: hypothetical protein IJV44_10215, partial [Prevotella sp.]|nr:hypothetical protein [Prevotella sp.]